MGVLCNGYKDGQLFARLCSREEEAELGALFQLDPDLWVSCEPHRGLVKWV